MIGYCLYQIPLTEEMVVAPEEMEGRMVDLEEMEGRVVAPEKTEKVLVVTMDPAHWREMPQEGQKLEKEKLPLEGEGLARRG